MPYTIGSNNLPENVKKLPAKSQRQWVHTFNSSFEAAKKNGKTDQEAEAIAFRNANGVVKKEMPEGSSFGLIEKFINTVHNLTASSPTTTFTPSPSDSLYVQKGVVETLSGGGGYLAIKGSNITFFSEMDEENLGGAIQMSEHDMMNRFGLYIVRDNKKSFELLDAGISETDAVEKALQMVENNRNKVRYVGICKSIPKMLGERPVFEIETLFYSVERSEDSIQLVETNDKSESENTDPSDVNLSVAIKSYLAEGLVYGIVYAPDEVDSHGDWTSEEEIQRAAHNFLPGAVMNIQHADDVQEVEVVESYIAPCNFILKSHNGTAEPVKKGSWVLVSRVNNAELKKAISEGKITGYSLEGTAARVPVSV